MLRLTLASSSKKRQKMLRDAGYDFDVATSDFDESHLMTGSPENCEKIAVEKVKRVDGDVVLAADTFIWFKNKIMGKPKNEKEAVETLKTLSGNWYDVYTGIAIKSNRQLVSFHERARVKFRELGEAEIQEYVEHCNVLKKSGSNSLAGYGSNFVECIEGNFYTIEGLPLSRIFKELKRFGIAPEPKNSCD